MIFTLTLNLDGAAFYDEDDFRPEPEIMRLLDKVSDRLEAKEPGATLYDTITDVNGNPVGSFSIRMERS